MKTQYYGTACPILETIDIDLDTLNTLSAEEIEELRYENLKSKFQEDI